MNTFVSLKTNAIAERRSTENEQATPRLKSFKDYYFGTIFRPRRTFDALMADDRRLSFGLIALSINAVLYTLVYIFLSAGGGAPSSFTPWLAIPAEVYYDYNRFFLAPSMFLCWILAAGVAQLLSRLFAGEGSFEDTLSVLGFGISIACLASLLHDLPDSFLGAIGLLNLREYEVALNTPTIWRASCSAHPARPGDFHRRACVSCVPVRLLYLQPVTTACRRRQTNDDLPSLSLRNSNQGVPGRLPVGVVPKYGAYLLCG
jgi:hypothetical protein